MAVKEQGFGMIVDTSADFARTSCDGLIVRQNGEEKGAGVRQNLNLPPCFHSPPPARALPLALLATPSLLSPSLSILL